MTTDPLANAVETFSAPIESVIIALGQGIADAQKALDNNSIAVAAIDRYRSCAFAVWTAGNLVPVPYRQHADQDVDEHHAGQPDAELAKRGRLARCC